MHGGRRGTVEAVAKVTAKGQTTIPKEVREALEIAPGDLIVWEVAPDRKAVVRRAQPWDLEYLRAVEGTLSEWTSPADEEAYRDL
jgi:AbrB family looped-hinge helix DNA binding protein